MTKPRLFLLLTSALLLLSGVASAQVAWLESPIEIRVALLAETAAPEGVEVNLDGEKIPLRALRLGFALKTLHLHLNAEPKGPGALRVVIGNPAMELEVRTNGVRRVWFDAEEKERWRGWLPHADLASSEELLRGTEHWRPLKDWRKHGGRWAVAKDASKAVAPAFDLGKEDADAHKRGQALFFKKGACDACHRLGGKGKQIGPSLDALGPADAARVARKVRDPFSSVHPGFLHRQITFGNGTSTIGVVRREGGVVVVADHTGSVQRYPASAVQVVYNLAGTIMPPQATEGWTATERAALVRFLCSEK